MGKPYQSEISLLPATISWALSVEIGPLLSFIREARGTTLVASGSGGSLSAAKLACGFHQIVGAGFSKSATPLELTSIGFLDTNASFLLLSAAGTNSDILAMFKRLGSAEPRRCVAVTAAVATPLSKLSRRYPCCKCFELEVPSGRDGFLATNSLMAFSLVLARAYTSAQDHTLGFSHLRRLINAPARWTQHIRALRTMTAPLWNRESLIVLYSPDLEAAAVDIESKFTEAAMGSVQIADYRHFAHGRHHWLAKRGENSAVMGLFTDNFQRLAKDTLACIPTEIPVVDIQMPGDAFEAGVGAMLTSILVAGIAGEHRGIDPGRPGVPEFGRKIYHLRWRPQGQRRKSESGLLELGVHRKLRALGLNDEASALFPWTKSAHSFCRRLAKQRLKGIVLDYDGTTVFTNERFGPVPPNVAATITTFLRSRIVVGVASGRGKSLRETLQRALPANLWSQVIVGYYNGSQTGLLSDDTLPKPLPPAPELLLIQEKLEAAATFFGGITMEMRHNQLSVIAREALDVEDLWRAVAEVLNLEQRDSVKVVRSGHSIDVIPIGTSKRSVVERVQGLADAERREVLCIGDKGHWPGNDSELLASFPSLSVDEVSTSSETCWNLAPIGCSGPDALAAYFSAIRRTKGGITLDVSRIRRVADDG